MNNRSTAPESDLRDGNTVPVTHPLEAKLGDILRELHEIIDQREELARQDKPLAERRAALEGHLLDYHKATYIDKLSADGLSVSFDGTALRTKYDPEKFADIFKWAAESGNFHIIQRRFTDKSVIDLVDAGVPLPIGLSLEGYTKISVRRTK